MKNIIMTTKCNCCANSTKVYTIYGLLKKAYETIDNDDRTKKILKYMGYTKHNVAIRQNRIRNDLEENCDQYNYEVIRGGKDGDIFTLYFNNSLTKIEGFAISKRYCTHQFDKIYTGTTANEFLVGLFNTLNIDISKFLKVDISKDGLNNLEVQTLTERNYFSTSDNQIDILTNSSHRDLIVKFKSEEETEINSEKYLHQTIIDMYPDYGGAIFWINSASTSIEEFKDFLPPDSPLALKIEDWVSLHNLEMPFIDFSKENKEEPCFDLVEFDNIGRKLHEELQEIVQEKFIITYDLSFEERCLRQYNLKQKQSKGKA